MEINTIVFIPLLATIKMDKNQILEYRKKIADEMYISAYYILTSAISEYGKSSEIIELSRELSAELRGKAYTLSYKKADKQAIEIESLLKLTIKINEEGIYQ